MTWTEVADRLAGGAHLLAGQHDRLSGAPHAAPVWAW